MNDSEKIIKNLNYFIKNIFVSILCSILCSLNFVILIIYYIQKYDSKLIVFQAIVNILLGYLFIYLTVKTLKRFKDFKRNLKETLDSKFGNDADITFPKNYE